MSRRLDMTCFILFPDPFGEDEFLWASIGTGTEKLKEKPAQNAVRLMPTVHQWKRSRMLKCPGRIVSTEAPWRIRTSSLVHILVKKILSFPVSVTHLWWSVGTFVTGSKPVGFISPRRQPCFVLSSPAVMSCNLLLGCQNPILRQAKIGRTHNSYGLVTSCSLG